RTRLTAAFLAVVLGPVVLGALFVGATTAAVNRSRALDRLDLATTALRGAIDALCERLGAAAQTAAVASTAGADGRGAQRVVEEGLADALLLTDATGKVISGTPGAPPWPWAECTGPATVSDVGAVAATLAMRDAGGQIIG